jgi:hypothetical protein
MQSESPDGGHWLDCCLLPKTKGHARDSATRLLGGCQRGTCLLCTFLTSGGHCLHTWAGFLPLLQAGA